MAHTAGYHRVVSWLKGSHYAWIHVPVLGPDGLPRHQRGTTSSPGLYFLGMHNQYSRGSSLIHWVRHDAAYIVSRARAHTTETTPGPEADDDNPKQPKGRGDVDVAGAPFLTDCAQMATLTVVT